VNDQLTISVITPSFNQGDFIRHTIESVLAQGGGGWEHVIVDGGSTDHSVSILKEYPHLIWVSEPDEGQSDALNKAMRRSSGELIFWINSDDVVAPGAFAAARSFFAEQTDAHIVCGNAVTIDQKGRETSRFPPRADANKIRRPWDGDTSIHQPSLVFRRGVYETVGKFDVSLNCAMDYDFFLRASSHFTFHHLPVDFGLFRKYPGTKTGGGTMWSFPEVCESLIRYVRETGQGSVRWTTVRAYLAQANSWVNDAVEFYEDGHPEFARRLLVRAGLRNPLSLVSRRHLYCRSRQILGPERLEALVTSWRRRMRRHG
jgi:glycosyltransferase involved in cell wall biosynthesis